ncbi:MAG: thiamine diphosphokinase [Paracoccaceae bacterium]
MTNTDNYNHIIATKKPIGLVAGGPVRRTDFSAVQKFASEFAAADGGANFLLREGLMPVAVYGDMDSLSLNARSSIAPDRLHLRSEQVTTDFDKALRSISAPLILALGTLGGRVDHELAVFNVLLRQITQPCVLVGPSDVIFAAPPCCDIDLDMHLNDRVSLFPMAQVAGVSQGLEWPVDGLKLDPMGLVGTSNRVTARHVRLRFFTPGMLIILPRARLAQAARTVQSLQR